jgi:hypothetical protein
MGRKYTDNALTLLASGLAIGGTTLAVTAGKGDNFPAITGRGAAGSAPDYFVITLEDSSGNREKIRVEHRAAGNDTLGSGGYPLVRGYDGTAPRTWLAGDSVDMRVDKSEAQDHEDKVAGAGIGRAFGYRGAGTVGLNFGYYGGVVQADGALTIIADGSVLLTASQTNFIERTPAGVVSANIVGFSADKIPLYTAVTDAGGVASYIDQRAEFHFHGRITKSVAGGADVVLTGPEARNDIIELTGAITADISVIWPAIKRNWLIKNLTTGTFDLTIKVAGQPGFRINQGACELVYGNGTDIVSAQHALPPGAIIDYAGTVIPDGFYAPDGSNKTRAGDPGLFANLMRTRTVTISIAAPAVVSWTNHRLSNGDVYKTTTTGALPTGLVAGTTYFVLNAATDTFQLAATEGGAAINTSGVQSGVHTGIHAPHGDGDGATTFTLPDHRRRSSTGRGGSPTATLGARLGATGGEESHALVTAELALHAHGVTDPTHGHGVTDATHGHGVTDGGHAHSDYYQVTSASTADQGSGGGGPTNVTGITEAGATTTTGASGSNISVNASGAGVSVNGAGSGISIQNTGSGTGHNTWHPVLVLTKLIKR